MNDAKPSKSALKREYLSRQALGEKLIRLTHSELAAMHLDDLLFRAVVDAKSIRSHSALRRQRQLIGKLMRNVDAARIESALEALGRQDRLAKNVFHAAEEWRDRLCAEGPRALAEFEDFAGHDNELLRSLLRERETAANEASIRAVRRRIFREVHNELMRMNENSSNPGQEVKK